ncbi:hypothetical protein [Streptomyces sp. NPDC026673]|uniref:hypothetical protein n=1 Tax=Streptomyces sp. NPDC026673 TaxID=3155724 RepID=UPI0033FF4CED
MTGNVRALPPSLDGGASGSPGAATARRPAKRADGAGSARSASSRTGGAPRQ